MFESIDITQILSLFGTFAGGGVLGWFTLSARRKRKVEADIAEAQAYKSMASQYEERLSVMHEIIRIHNNTSKEQSETIARLNHALDDKTERIRTLTDKLWEAEQEINCVNAELVKAQEEIGKLNLKVEHYKEWRCYWHDCKDTRGRKQKQEKKHTEDGQEPE